MPAESLLDAMTQTAQSLGALPWAVHALAVAAIGAGLVLWLAGRKVLKPAIVILFALAGGAAGAALAPILPWNESLSPVTGAGVGLIAGGVMGLMLFRFAMAVSLGLVLGLAAPLTLAAATAMPLPTAPPPAVPPAPIEPERPLASAPAAPDWGHSVNTNDPLSTVSAIAGDEVRGMARAAADDLENRWESLGTERQALLVLAAAAGAVVGVMLGLILPLWAAGAVSAVLGPAVWLPCAVWLADSLAVPGHELLDRQATEWLIIWGALAGVGLLVQWSGLLSGRRTQGRCCPA